MPAVIEIFHAHEEGSPFSANDIVHVINSYGQSLGEWEHIDVLPFHFVFESKPEGPVSVLIHQRSQTFFFLENGFEPLKLLWPTLHALQYEGVVHLDTGFDVVANNWPNLSGSPFVQFVKSLREKLNIKSSVKHTWTLSKKGLQYGSV